MELAKILVAASLEKEAYAALISVSRGSGATLVMKLWHLLVHPYRRKITSVPPSQHFVVWMRVLRQWLLDLHVLLD